MIPTARPVRVLVADDQAIHREMIVRALQSSPHFPRLEITTASDGDAALAAIRHGIDLAFLDIRMPGKSGFDVLAAVRANRSTSRLAAIIVSSSSDHRDRATAHRLGALAYVEKGRFPVFREQLLGALAQVLDGKPLE